MFFKSTIIAAALTLSCATGAAAMTFPTFELDTNASTIKVTQGSGCEIFSCATLTGSFGDGATGFSWEPTGANDSIWVSDFFKWTVSGEGLEIFDVVVNLVFSSPDQASASGEGDGGFFSVSTFLGTISGGFLHWTDVGSVTFAQGSTLDIGFDDVFALGIGTSTTSGATFTGSPIVASAPIPASIPLLGGALLALAAVGRRRLKRS